VIRLQRPRSKRAGGAPASAGGFGHAATPSAPGPPTSHKAPVSSFCLLPARHQAPRRHPGPGTRQGLCRSPPGWARTDPLPGWLRGQFQPRASSSSPHAALPPTSVIPASTPASPRAPVSRGREGAGASSALGQPVAPTALRGPSRPPGGSGLGPASVTDACPVCLHAWPPPRQSDGLCACTGCSHAAVGLLRAALSPGPSTGVLGAGRWALGAGCWVLGAGRWVLAVGCWVLGAWR